MGRTLNGEMFATLVLSYTEALNSGEVPEINSAWTRVISTQCNEAKQNALELYDSAILEELGKKRPATSLQRGGSTLSRDMALPVDIETLKVAHQVAKAKSKHEYRTKVCPLCLSSSPHRLLTGSSSTLTKRHLATWARS
jgi:hypothetical protein